jgi:ABC-type methionine transport system ATPase subunit
MAYESLVENMEGGIKRICEKVIIFREGQIEEIVRVKQLKLVPLSCPVLL